MANNPENILECWYENSFSEELAYSAYFFYCRMYANDRLNKKPSPYHELALQINHLRTKCKNKNYFDPKSYEMLKMESDEVKSHPDFWIKEYQSYITCKTKLGRIPDTGKFIIPLSIYNRLSFDPDFKSLKFKEDVVIQ